MTARDPAEVMREVFELEPARRRGQDQAARSLEAAQVQADALAAGILAATQCPPDLIEWGRIHGIPAFAALTWQAGYRAGMRAAQLAIAEGPGALAAMDERRQEAEAILRAARRVEATHPNKAAILRMLGEAELRQAEAVKP